MNILPLLTCLLGSIECALGLDVCYGDSVDFPETVHCMKTGAELLFEHQLVAHWDGEKWREGSDYVNRIRPGKSVTLNEATMNDDGLFVLVCPGEEEMRTQVNVAAVRDVVVAAGTELSLFFFSKTRGAQGEFKVMRKGEKEPVLNLNFASGTPTIRPDFKDRLSLPRNWKTHGNLTVTVKPVTEKDQGDFFFYVEGRDGGKKLSAWRVTVKNTLPPGSTGGNLETWKVVGALVIGLFFFTLRYNFNM